MSERSNWHFSCTPGYGRDYTNMEDVLADWIAEMDFVNENQHLTGGGRYINAQQCNSATITYDKGQKQVVLKRQPDDSWAIDHHVKEGR
jgi:hypothetical protein